MVLLPEVNLQEFKVPYLDDWSTYVIPEIDPDIALARDESDHWKFKLDSLEWMQEQWLDVFQKNPPQFMLDYIDEAYYQWRNWDRRRWLYVSVGLKRHIGKYGIMSMASGVPRREFLTTVVA